MDKNPIWVHEVEKDEIKVYKRGREGKRELKVRDPFCVGCKDFVWFNLREIDGVHDDDVKMELGVDFNEIEESLRGEIECLGGGNISYFEDPVKG